jgi:flagellar assembly protein FliH
MENRDHCTLEEGLPQYHRPWAVAGRQGSGSVDKSFRPAITRAAVVTVVAKAREQTFEENAVASVIRSPRLNKKPRKLQGAEEVVERPLQPEPAAQIQETGGFYAEPVENTAPLMEQVAPEPGITEEELAALKRRLEQAESRAEAAEHELAAIRSGLEQLRTDAREQGYAAGCQQANDRLDAEYQRKLESVQAVLQGISSRLEQLVSHAEDTMVETIYAAVVKIIGERMVEPENILSMIRHVSSQLVRPENFTVRLAPADYELVMQARSHPGDNEIAAVKIVADPRVELGGCILESVTGSLDARLEVQLQRLKGVLLDSRARRQSELQAKK